LTVYYKEVRPSFFEKYAAADDLMSLTVAERKKKLSFVAEVDLDVLESILAEVTRDDLKNFGKYFLEWTGRMSLVKKVKKYELSAADSKTELRAVMLLVAISFTNVQDIVKKKNEVVLLDLLHLITNDAILSKRYSETIHCFAIVISGISESPVCCCCMLEGSVFGVP
jgi:hypothetical protein